MNTPENTLEIGSQSTLVDPGPEAETEPALNTGNPSLQNTAAVSTCDPVTLTQGGQASVAPQSPAEGSLPTVKPTVPPPSPFKPPPLPIYEAPHLTEAEQIDLFACEEVVANISSAVMQAGLALAQIRDQRLYREEFHSFEAYCRVKWQYGRNYVDRLISAAQLFTLLMTNCHENKPQYESQVRPLIGLTPKQADQVWKHAAEKAGNRRITAAIVKSSMRDLELGNPRKAVATHPRVNKAKQRQLIDQAIGELMVLSSQRVSHEVLSKKIESLHGLIRALFPPA